MHDERTILANRTTALLCLSEMLVDGVFGTLEGSQKAAVLELLRAAQDLKDLIHANRASSFFD